MINFFVINNQEMILKKIMEKKRERESTNLTKIIKICLIHTHPDTGLEKRFALFRSSTVGLVWVLEWNKWMTDLFGILETSIGPVIADLKTCNNLCLLNHVCPMRANLLTVEEREMQQFLVLCFILGEIKKKSQRNKLNFIILIIINWNL